MKFKAKKVVIPLMTYGAECGALMKWNQGILEMAEMDTDEVELRDTVDGGDRH